MKVLVVKFTPRVGSNTEKLLNVALDELTKRNDEIEILDLNSIEVPMLKGELLNSYSKRREGDELQKFDLAILEPMDTLTIQFVNSDLVVFAYPIYNYSMPSVVKAYFDAIVQSGLSFNVQDPEVAKKIKEKKVIVINTSSGTMIDSSSDFSSPLVRRILSLLQIHKIHFISAMGLKFIGFNEGTIEKFKNEFIKLL